MESQESLRSRAVLCSGSLCAEPEEPRTLLGVTFAFSYLVMCP